MEEKDSWIDYLNEVEIMEFKVNNKYFGINVSKIVEIMKYEEVSEMPKSLPFVEGVFKPRDKIITVINLPKYLNEKDSDDLKRDIFIIVNINLSNVAFHVHSVDAIHKVKWEDIQKPDEKIYGKTLGLATGIIKMNDKIITIIDFEKILFESNPNQIFESEEVSSAKSINKPIILVDDSQMIINLMKKELQKIGFNNLKIFNTGLDAWNYITKKIEDNKNIDDVCHCLITDLEIPEMGGHNLIKNLRHYEATKKLPIIIFSSLLNERYMIAGEELNVDAQVLKPNLDELLDELNKI